MNQGGFYPEIGIFLRPATGSGLGGVPCDERLFDEPNRDIATLAQRFVIFEPFGHLCNAFFSILRRRLELCSYGIGSSVACEVQL